MPPDRRKAAPRREPSPGEPSPRPSLREPPRRARRERFRREPPRRARRERFRREPPRRARRERFRRERGCQARRRAMARPVPGPGGSGGGCTGPGRRPGRVRGVGPTSLPACLVPPAGRGGRRSAAAGAHSVAGTGDRALARRSAPERYRVPARRRSPGRRAACRSAVPRAVPTRAAQPRAAQPRAARARAARARAGRRGRACRHGPGRSAGRRALVRHSGERSAEAGPAGPGTGVPAGGAAAGAASHLDRAATVRSRLPRRLRVGPARPHHPPRSRQRAGNRRRQDRVWGHSRGGLARVRADRTRHGRGRCRHVPPNTSWTLVSSRAAGHLPLPLECRSAEIPSMT